LYCLVRACACVCVRVFLNRDWRDDVFLNIIVNDYGSTCPAKKYDSSAPHWPKCPASNFRKVVSAPVAPRFGPDIDSPLSAFVRSTPCHFRCLHTLRVVLRFASVHSKLYLLHSQSPIPFHSPSSLPTHSPTSEMPQQPNQSHTPRRSPRKHVHSIRPNTSSNSAGSPPIACSLTFPSDVRNDHRLSDTAQQQADNNIQHLAHTSGGRNLPSDETCRHFSNLTTQEPLLRPHGNTIHASNPRDGESLPPDDDTGHVFETASKVPEVQAASSRDGGGVMDGEYSGSNPEAEDDSEDGEVIKYAYNFIKEHTDVVLRKVLKVWGRKLRGSKTERICRVFLFHRLSRISGKSPSDIFLHFVNEADQTPLFKD